MASNTLRMMESSLERTARALSSNWGVKVVFAGTCPMAADGVIYLPYNADDLSDDVKQLVHGSLDHETLHVAEDQLSASKRQQGPTSLFRSIKVPQIQMLFNVLEDIRIERKYSVLYPGMAENLHRNNLHATEMWASKMAKKEPADFWTLFGVMIIALKRNVSYTWVPAPVQAWIPVLAEELAAIDDMNDHFDVAKLSKRIYDKISDICEELKNPPAPGGDGEGDGDDEEGDGGGTSLAAPPEMMPSSDGDGGKSSKAPSKDGTSPSSPSSSSSSSDSSDSAAPSPSSDVSEKSDDGSSETATPHGETPKPDSKDRTPSKSKRTTGPKPSEEDSSEKPPKPDISKFDPADSKPSHIDINHKASSDTIETAARSDYKENKRYIPDPTCQALDRWFKPRASSGNQYADDLAEVKDQVNALRSKLLSALRVMSVTREVGDQKHGSLDAASLHSVRTGNRRIFSNQIRGLKLDVAVSVLIDLSGSMGPASHPGTKSQTARKVAVALAETFDQLKVPAEVIGFHNNSDRMPDIRHSRDSIYQSREPFDFLVLKEFSEPLRSVRGRFAAINGMDDNADGEAVRMVGRRLASRTEKVKMLIVLSDGSPCAAYCDHKALGTDLRDAIKELTKAGVVVMGFGILTNDVKDFYNADNGASSVVIDRLSNMTPVIYKAIRDKFIYFAKAG